MIITASKLDKVEAYLSETQQFQDTKIREQVIQQGDRIVTMFPNTIFLTIVTKQGESLPGDFLFEMEFKDRDPDTLTDLEKYGEKKKEDVIDQEVETGRVVVTGELENVQQYAWLEGDSFFFVLLTSGALLATLIFLCCCAWLVLRKADPVGRSPKKGNN